MAMYPIAHYAGPNNRFLRLSHQTVARGADALSSTSTVTAATPSSWASMCNCSSRERGMPRAFMFETAAGVIPNLVAITPVSPNISMI